MVGRGTLHANARASKGIVVVGVDSLPVVVSWAFRVTIAANGATRLVIVHSRAVIVRATTVAKRGTWVTNARNANVTWARIPVGAAVVVVSRASSAAEKVTLRLAARSETVRPQSGRSVCPLGLPTCGAPAT